MDLGPGTLIPERPDIALFEGVPCCNHWVFADIQFIPGVELSIKRIGDDVNGLCGGVSLSQQIDRFSIGTFGTPNNDHCMTRAARRNQDIASFDVISMEAIQSRIEPLLLKHADDQIDLFISPGTPAMQTAWVLAHLTLNLNTRLLQVRPKQFTKEQKAA